MHCLAACVHDTGKEYWPKAFSDSWQCLWAALATQVPASQPARQAQKARTHSQANIPVCSVWKMWPKGSWGLGAWGWAWDGSLLSTAHGAQTRR
jgi:hypothetical protein